LPAKNDNAVYPSDRGDPFAGKPRFYRLTLRFIRFSERDSSVDSENRIIRQQTQRHKN